MLDSINTLVMCHHSEDTNEQEGHKYPKIQSFLATTILLGYHDNYLDKYACSSLTVQEAFGGIAPYCKMTCYTMLCRYTQ